LAEGAVDGRADGLTAKLTAKLCQCPVVSALSTEYLIHGPGRFPVRLGQ
jgi:hypothetical protein